MPTQTDSYKDSLLIQEEKSHSQQEDEEEHHRRIPSLWTALVLPGLPCAHCSGQDKSQGTDRTHQAL